MQKCPLCGGLNDDNWPLDVEGETKEGGCQNCWEAQADKTWWDQIPVWSAMGLLGEPT